jgi:asparagine N-glycosylation enzyme membrane subunit Stt3
LKPWIIYLEPFKYTNWSSYMERIWVIGLAIALIAAFSLRAGPLDDPHTLAYDTEGMLKFSRQIVELGHIPENEPMRYAGYFEEGWDNREILPLTPYLIAFLSFGQENLVKRAAMWYPIIFGLLSIVIVAYIGKELFGYPGLAAGIILGVMPGFIFRTSAGFNDKEAVGIFLMVLGVYFFVSAFKKKNFYLSTLAGISFGISSIGWGGFYLFMIPISLFIVWEVLIGNSKRTLVYLPLVLSLLIYAINISAITQNLDQGLGVLTSYNSLLLMATAGYLLFDYLFGMKLAKTEFGETFNSGIRDFLGGLGRPFSKIKLPETSILSGLASLAIGVLVLMAMGRDPLTTFENLGAYLQNPIRGGIHARSVGEQTAITWGHWDSELNVMKVLTYPFLTIINPTTTEQIPILNLFTTSLHALVGMEYTIVALMVISSIPLIGVLLFLEPKWEYLFAVAWAFFANFSANAAVRLFFPLMPAVAVSGAALISYIVTRKEEFVRGLGYLITMVIFLALLIVSVDASRMLGTSMDPFWFHSLTWYKHNSKIDSPLATWWDYGYWIFNIADRPSLADGSNSYPSANVDLGKFFTYQDESKAINYLKEHDTKFVIMDGTMIPKFYWVSSIGFNDESKAITYPQFSYVGDADTTLGRARIYQSGRGDQILVIGDGVIYKDVQLGYTALEKIATEKGYFENPINATKAPGAVFIASNIAFYISPEAENIIFTKLYLLNGYGLEYFNSVFDNGFIKLYEAEYS